ncbi:preprotein translocase subunit SecG [Candidatus Amesbacteria bacterium RIFCSPHIGHO2_01_FULL_48_32]|uniref:Protein-export membrane protein SecG n=1 Tax=Candidatus Amesbacteria bacterium RIFCSPLOWO2_01_FULL_48_25 TaxID=1797259 RepID=A0A1F4ZEL7_9BACT|nr:MAG: preprotein translocase subunit SecG [Candidatus Amesbacteria bacterium RIFCSPHIGHO2_01_FULL_48_32]OGD03884.1 MAG: preprotein translocase subunit SecG [Candidatus Amesbacteria bacterium RIFCSPLOWO2_01_FULL_48_25]HJZ05452.1 preprotein translocase subunit SecG [Patescibacteria group bacterium]
MHEALTIVQIIVAVIMAGLILLQAKGVGLGRSLGGLYHSKRGIEILVFRATIILAVLFVTVSASVALV